MELQLDQLKVWSPRLPRRPGPSRVLPWTGLSLQCTLLSHTLTLVLPVSKPLLRSPSVPAPPWLLSQEGEPPLSGSALLSLAAAQANSSQLSEVSMLSGLCTRRKQGSLCVSFESLMAERDAEAKNESSPCPPISEAEALPGRGLQAVKWTGSGPALTRIQAYMVHIPTPSETGTHRPSAFLPQCPFFAEEYEFFLSLLAPKPSFLKFETTGCHLPTEQIGKLGAGPCSESHKPIVETGGRKAAGPLCSSKAFALYAQDPELAAQQLYLWSPMLSSHSTR